jgi:hypothetical protein
MDKFKKYIDWFTFITESFSTMVGRLLVMAESFPTVVGKGFMQQFI